MSKIEIFPKNENLNLVLENPVKTYSNWVPIGQLADYTIKMSVDRPIV